jgi:hypothetical protein
MLFDPDGVHPCPVGAQKMRIYAKKVNKPLAVSKDYCTFAQNNV